MTPQAALTLLQAQPADVRDAACAVLRGLVACEEAVRYFGWASWSRAWWGGSRVRLTVREDMLDLQEIRAHAGKARMDLQQRAHLPLSLEWALVTVAQLVEELERTRNTLMQQRVDNRAQELADASDETTWAEQERREGGPVEASGK